MTTPKAAIIDLCIACGNQSLQAIIQEVKTQATFDKTADLRTLILAILGNNEFHLDADSQTYQYRDFH